MPRIVAVCQEAGGVGKSTTARALAECVPDAAILEIDSSHRLVEYDGRVRYFPMRADRVAIERTGGRAARAEFDGVIAAIGDASVPTIVDVGANTGTALLVTLADLAAHLADVGVEFGLAVVTTAEPAALAEVPRLLQAGGWAARRWVVANEMRGPVPCGELPPDVGRGVLPEQVLEDQARELLAAGGLASIPALDGHALVKTYGIALGSRIRRDLAHFRADAMSAVREPAMWLAGAS